MNARERAKELAELFELHDNAYVAGVIRDLLAEVEHLEEELKTQKRAAWNHEGVSKDYILAMKKLRERDRTIAELEKQLADSADLPTIAYINGVAESGERLTALTRQRDMLSDYVRERADRCGHCDNCWSRCYINQAKQALVAAGMEGKNETCPKT